MLNPLRKLDTTPKVEQYAVARGLALAYTAVLAVAFLLVACLARGGGWGVLLPLVALCVVFWGNVIWLLATLPTPAERCPQCDYRLRGLSVLRCPECGRPFSFDEVRSTPEQLDFAGWESQDASPSP